MTTRIPPSLKWLINKRARLQGDIAKAEKELTELIKLKQRDIQSLRNNLASVDNTIRLHEIRIDPTLIRPIRGPTNSRFFAHGGLTNLVLSCVSKAHPHPISTTDIAISIAESVSIDLQGEDFSALRTSVRHRMKQICSSGWVDRTHATKTFQEGSWQLSPKAILYFKQVIE
ncbi:MAG: hypothetical protein FD173_219 [Gallionellaceae bacterium]|nr:MAG: hypothetical protein FD173_219 [Gallionellaceae bacterium]